MTISDDDKFKTLLNFLSLNGVRLSNYVHSTYREKLDLQLLLAQTCECLQQVIAKEELNHNRIRELKDRLLCSAGKYMLYQQQNHKLSESDLLIVEYAKVFHDVIEF